ncbi:MAG: SAM-dependent methyltransferase [Bacteroidota bacterium]|nr:SAM-dependent methyltransferase [Bacteroidota bacterium]
MTKGTLYLLPSGMGTNDPFKIIPAYNVQVMGTLNHFIVENGKTARAFLKEAVPGIVLQEKTYYELNNHTEAKDFVEYMKPLHAGENIGLMSEAGCPGIADPGAEIVKLAHDQNIKVVPLVGPSSIFMALMASGFNGQSFAFNGYLPRERQERSRKIKEFERLAATKNQAQLFIETPYRNEQLLEELLNVLPLASKLLIACDITTSNEYIKTKFVADWKKQTLPNLSKRPCIFGIG